MAAQHDRDASAASFSPPRVKQTVTVQRPTLRQSQLRLELAIAAAGEIQLSISTCRICFVLLACVMALVPVKDYVLGSYVTKTFDEVRDNVVARKPHGLSAVVNSAHYFDMFARDALPLVDAQTHTRLTRSASHKKTLINLLVGTSVSRRALLTNLPTALLATKVSLMDDYYAPVCGPAWRTDARLVFGNYFPEIHHEFCRDYGALFPLTRFFRPSIETPGATTPPRPPLGVIGLVNTTEVHLRQFRSLEVVRALTRSIASGFLAPQETAAKPSGVNYTDATADTAVMQYSSGITIAELIALLPGDTNEDESEHVRLIDIAGVNVLLQYFVSSQQLEMGWNVNSERAVVAELSYVTTPVLTLESLVTELGMSPLFATYIAPFWNCAIERTTMAKDLQLDQIGDVQAFVACGREKVALLPTYTVNLMYLVQRSFRDYAKLDNTSTMVLGRDRALAFDVPETLTSAPLLVVDGSAWGKVNNFTQASPPTPYGYIYTIDCAHAVDLAVQQQQGRNALKYQAYIGDGMGDCQFHDSQETEPQVLCRLIFGPDEVLLRDLDGNVHANLSACSDLAPLASMERQNAFRQIEWFNVETELLTKRMRVSDNTSRQLRTFLLLLALLGSISYVCEYLAVLKSLWVFLRNSGAAAQGSSQARPLDISTSDKPTVSKKSHGGSGQDRAAHVSCGIPLREFAQFDAALGALQYPSTIVLLFLGSVGALSNIFSLACTADIAASDGQIVIVCQPSITITSVWLYFTTLSSAFWIALVAQQLRPASQRLRDQQEPHWARKWLLWEVAVLAIYAVCKLSTDFTLANVTLRSDPHVYAMGGGAVISLFILLAFRAIHFSECRACRVLRASESNDDSGDSDYDKVRLDGTGPVRCFPSFLPQNATKAERAFLARWNSSELDAVVQHCASPTAALQLLWYCSQLRSREQHAQLNAPRRPPSSQSRRIKVGDTDATAAHIHVGEFVTVHIVAGAWKHLETLAWRFDHRRQTFALWRLAHAPDECAKDEDKATTKRTAFVVPVDKHVEM